MSKPDWCPQEVWGVAHKVTNSYCGCAPGRRRLNGTNHSDSCWDQTEMVARAILAAKAEERGACLAAAEEARDENASGEGEVYISDKIIAAIRKRGS